MKRAGLLFFLLFIFIAAPVYAQSADDYIEQGFDLIADEDYPAAIKVFHAAIELDPLSGTAYKGRADAYYYAEMYPAAILDYSKALEMKYHSAWQIYYRRGYSYRSIEQLELALQDFTSSIQEDPTHDYVYHSRAITYHWMGRYEFALADYNQAIDLEPRDPSSHYFNRGLVYLALDENERAIADFEQSLVYATGESAEAYFEMGLAYYGLDEYEKALSSFEKALELDSEPPEYYFRRGEALNDLDEFERAIEDFTEALERGYSRQFAVYENRSYAYHSLFQYNKALADINQAIELNDRIGEVYYKRGDIFFDMDFYERARDDFETAEQLGYTSAYLYHEWGLAIHRMGDFDGAINKYTEALNRNYNSPEIPYYNRGLAYNIIGKYEAALADFNQAAEFAPDDPDIYEQRGEAHYQLKQYDLMKQDYETYESLTGGLTAEMKSHIRSSQLVAIFGHQVFRIGVLAATVGSLFWWGTRRQRKRRRYRNFKLPPLSIPPRALLETIIVVVGGLLGLVGLALFMLPLIISSLFLLSVAVISDKPRHVIRYGAGLSRRKYASAAQSSKALWGDSTLQGHQSAGKLLFRAQDYAGAAAEFTEAYGLAVDDQVAVNILFQRAICHKRMGNQAAEIRDYDQASDLAPRNPIPYFQLGSIYLAKREYHAALANFVKAINVGGKTARLYYSRGTTYWSLGDQAAAHADYRKALQLNGKDSGAHISMGTYCLENGEYEQALRHYGEAYSLSSGWTNALLGIALAHFLLDEIELARQHWTSLLEKDARFGDATWIEAQFGKFPHATNATRQMIERFENGDISQ